MTKRALAIVVVLIALPLSASEKWWDFYKRGVTAVQAGNFQAAIDPLQRSLSEMPNESASVRPRNETFVYVPHYWLGVARFQLGDVEAAMHEWRTSEEQGAVQKTPFYAQLRDWVARAQSQKQRASDTAAADVKREASGAVGRAVSAQMDAVAAGADRSDQYRAAQRKLQEAMEAANGPGADVRAYRHSTDLAQQARDLFAAAADTAKKQKAARPAAVARQIPPPQPQPQEQKPPVVVAVEPPRPAPQQVVVQPPAVQIAEIPVPKPVATPELSAPAPARTDGLRSQLEAAYRAFAAGDLTSSEQLLSGMITTSPNGEAFLLRGCARYTRAMLSRRPDLREAAADFRAALKANPALHLDRRSFSPKLVAFFEDVKRKI